MNISNFIEINAEKFVTKPAIGFKKYDEWKDISWQMFRRTIYKTANALKKLGIKENDRVAIYADNSAEWIIMDLATMAIGAITVPIYATNNKEQTLYCIKDSEAKAVMVGNQEQYDACAEIMQECETLEHIIAAKKSTVLRAKNSCHFETIIVKSPEDLEIVPKEEDDIATIIYTSGTSGTPKGVMITHGNFANAFEAHFEFFKFKNFTEETSLAFLPLSHIFERSWTLLCLYGGAKVVFLENTKLIAHTLEKVKPTMMCAVPRFYQKIYCAIQENLEKSNNTTKKRLFYWALKQGEIYAELKRQGKSIPLGLRFRNGIANALVFKKIKKKLGGNLWFMPCGGASISPEIIKFFDTIGVHITVGYGLTETTATLTCFPNTHYEYGTAGVPIGSTQIKIGENNEILVKGKSVMKGYYKMPEENEKVFTRDGWFKTGDAGIFKNNTLTITDRIKDLMKTSNGKYIIPQSIENLLTNSNLIQQVMVVAEGKPYVTALIVPNFEVLEKKLNALGVKLTSWKETLKNEKIYQLYQDVITELLNPLSGYEKIKKFVLLPKDFEIHLGEITPTLKIRRQVVMSKYANEIESLYF
ncbi:AMP-dependent synthetase/ligase [Riemerella columbipharyngis]|uniref:Long-chain acyl-CoA synthetase n=1 Tax=Riemerella columbipharyngis TaxID=1071918 RepID=A0A1G6ZMY4_9FLAO|nr:long-chain fatty acid--CoA ligase [Riemerella columbipharyngis]SDE03929.1 long-chain acyl-CoA synthetase [Riemerella columbipharyngis]